MKILPILSLAAALLPWVVQADTDTAAEAAPHHANCTAAAKAASVKLPPLALQCDDSHGGSCDDASAAPGHKAMCAAAGPAYTRTLQRILRPAWWSVPAEELEACREQKEGGSPELGAGAVIQGGERVRLLVLVDKGCPGDGGDIYNVVLAVLSDRGVAVNLLAVDYYEPHQEAPFWLDVLHDGADTLALFTVQSHDMQDAYTFTKAYKVNLAAGSVSPYPLYLMADGAHSSIESSVRIGADDDSDQGSEAPAPAAPAAASEGNGNPQQQEQAKPADDANKEQEGPVGPQGRNFDNVQVNICPDDDKKCPPMIEYIFSWNGKAYAVDRYEEARQEFLRRLSVHRECLKAKFDPKIGDAECPVEAGDYYNYDDNCESNNDLSYLNFKAGNAELARSRAGKALEECKDNPRELAAAQFNDRRSRGQR